MEKEFISIETGHLAEVETCVIDNSIRFEDGRLYITRTPYKNGRQSDYPEKIDVTEEVAEAIKKVLKERKPLKGWEY